ncbi:MAG: TIGR00730 family Rossman fold protein [Muribaculaceae bacterium]|nr:TIGR00730 family Rossman fold protein [Muribaculaceae bacterium]
MRIAVYCSAKSDLPQHVVDDTRRFGTWIGLNGHTLVYGGLDKGLMGVVAQAAADAGATVVGVVPQARLANQHQANSVNIMCATLHERKQIMEENADIFVALDGGIGTLDEVFAALASMTFFGDPKPIVMLNRDHSLDPLTHLMANLVTRGLATPPASRRIAMADDIDQLIDIVGSQAQAQTTE